MPALGMRICPSSEASVNNVLTEFPAAQAFDSSASYILLCLLFSYEKAHLLMD